MTHLPPTFRCSLLSTDFEPFYQNYVGSSSQIVYRRALFVLLFTMDWWTVWTKGTLFVLKCLTINIIILACKFVLWTYLSMTGRKCTEQLHFNLPVSTWSFQIILKATSDVNCLQKSRRDCRVQHLLAGALYSCWCTSNIPQVCFQITSQKRWRL